MTKGIAIRVTNLKPMDGGLTLAPLPVGGWVYGAKGTTDITGFTHYYRPDGTRVELGKLCKATLSNLKTSEEAEPIDPTPPASYQITEMRRKSFDGGLSWTEWEYWGMNKLP